MFCSIMDKLTVSSFIIIPVFVLSGCATIINDDLVEIPVVSAPPAAMFTFNQQEYLTPTVLKIPRGEDDFTLKFEKEGYHPQDVQLSLSLDGWLWGNLVGFGLLGLAVDFISGDAYDIEPEEVEVSLVDKGQSLVAESPLEWEPDFIDSSYVISLEVGLGQADITSSVTSEYGDSYTVANGRAKYFAVKLSMDSGLNPTGWNYGFRPNFFHQKISIADFKKSIPFVDDAYGVDIPIIVTEFQTGLAVDPLDPNVYEISYNSVGISGYLSKGVSLPISKKMMLYLSVDAALGLLNIEAVDILYGKSSRKETRLEYLNYFSLDLNSSLQLPTLNSIISFGVGYEQFPEIEAPDELEFRDPNVILNREKNVFERKRIFLNKLKLEAVEYHLTYTLFF